MKKAFKTIFIYLGVILLASIATVIFCAGFLFFYRDGNIFGIQYISTNEFITAKESEDMSDLQSIEVNSQSFDVYVRVNPNVSSVMGAMKNKVFGYAKKSKAHASFVLEYDEVSKTAVFDSVQPKGWLNKKDSYIEIAIPTNVADDGIDLKVKTSKGDIYIGNNYDWSVGDLVIETTKGDTTITNTNLNNNIIVNIGKGLVYIDDKCTTTSFIGADISVGSGTVNFAKIDTDNFRFGVVNVKSITRGKIGIIKAEELVTDGNIGGGGKIEIGDVGFVDFSSLDTDLAIKKISGNLNTSRINITGYGDVFIKQSFGNLIVNGHNGDITVETATGSTSLITNQGDIKMTDAFKLVEAVAAYGNINIKFNESALDYNESAVDDNNKNRAVIASTKNGHIVIKGLQYGSVHATDKGRITLDYNKVMGNNEVSAKSGVVNITVPNPPSGDLKYAFNLYVNSEVNSDVKVGVVGSLDVDYNGSGDKVFTNIYGTAGTNNLKVSSTTGIIKIRSRDLVGY